MENSPKSPIEMATNHKKDLMIIEQMFEELRKADAKYHHDRMSVEEIESSLLTLECELMELKREVKRKKKRSDLLAKEAIQVLAMAFKFNRDVVYGQE